jgi:MerR family transcriptional regulator/heat shock protein HspR
VRSGSDGPEADRRGEDRAVYIISVAAELAGVHPQTLRIYERKGLVSPKRTAGNTRRYSERDIRRLRTIQELTQEHRVNLAGARMIIDLVAEVERLRERLEKTETELRRVRREPAAPWASSGAIVPFRTVVGILGQVPPLDPDDTPEAARSRSTDREETGWTSPS